MSKKNKKSPYYLFVEMPKRFVNPSCVMGYEYSDCNVFEFTRHLRVGEKLVITKEKDAQVASQIRKNELAPWGF